jgi:hypothetical protein
LDDGLFVIGKEREIVAVGGSLAYGPFAREDGVAARWEAHAETLAKSRDRAL